MRYCHRCLYPENHPLMLGFDETGVCLGCRVHEEKDQLDWRERETRLSAILDSYRGRSASGYDCIVPVSGARDSYFILHTIRKVYGLNPLLVSYNRQYNTAAGMHNLERLRTLLGSDIITETINPEWIKRISRTTLERLGSFHWHHLAGSTVFPVRMAVRMNIPLIVWGHHQGLDQVGMFSHLDEVEMTRRYRREHDLMGCEAEDLVDVDGLSENDLRSFFYPSDIEINRSGIRGIYLGNYIRWDTKKQHESMLKKYDYYTGPQQGTFDTYNDVDCQHYSGIHDYIKFVKWGYGKATDHACREIRFGRLSREDGVALVEQRRWNRLPADADAFARWVGMDLSDVLSAVDRHRDPAIWARGRDGEWELKDHVGRQADGDGVEAARLPRKEDGPFLSNRPAPFTASATDAQLLTQGQFIP